MRRPLKRSRVNRGDGQVIDNVSDDVSTARSMDSPWVGRLLTLHRQVRSAVAKSDRAGTGSKNAKDDDVKLFDLAANDAALDVLREFQQPLIVDSEEGQRREIGSGTPRHLLVLDPVDGSDNWGRGLPLSAVSVAVLPTDSPITPARVCWAMVGDLRERLPLTAHRGNGGYHGSRRICTSGVQTLSTAFLSCELNHFDPPPSVGKLLQRARGVRAYGCASQAMTMVATGALDVHVDLRSRLTPENFLAAALILEESGGCVVSTDGQPLHRIDSLISKTNLIAAATAELAQEVVNALVE